MRWSRNSYRCYLTAMYQGWLWRQPLITQVTVLQILFTPLTMVAAVYYGAAGSPAAAQSPWRRAGLGGASGRALRAVAPAENPRGGR